MPPTSRSQVADKRLSKRLQTLSNPRHSATAAYADRLNDILDLVHAHHALTGSGQGGRRDAPAINRAALVLLCGHFQGFIVELFTECWQAKYPGSMPDKLTDGLSNPWPARIDELFALVGHARVMRSIEPRPTKRAVGQGTVTTYVEPTLVREPSRRTDFQARSVIEEMVHIRNRSAHGGRLTVRMRDLTNYLSETVEVASRIDKAV